jgi:hypothetical protein
VKRTKTLARVATALMEDPNGRHWGYDLSKRSRCSPASSTLAGSPTAGSRESRAGRRAATTNSPRTGAASWAPSLRRLRAS